MEQQQEGGEGKTQSSRNRRKSTKRRMRQAAEKSQSKQVPAEVKGEAAAEAEETKSAVYMFLSHGYGPNSHTLYAVNIPDPLPVPSSPPPTFVLNLFDGGLEVEEQPMSPPVVEFPRSEYPVGMCAVEFDSKLYFIGGEFVHWKGRFDTKYPADFYVFDPTPTSSSPLSKHGSRLNTGKFNPVAFAADGKIYVVSAMVWMYETGDKLSRFEVFNPDDDDDDDDDDDACGGKWTKLKDPPFKCSVVVGHAVVNRKVFISCNNEGLFFFDLDSNRWTKIAPDEISYRWIKLSEEERTDPFRQGMEEEIPSFQGRALFVEDTLYGCCGTTVISFGPLAAVAAANSEEDEEWSLFDDPGALLSPDIMVGRRIVYPSVSLTHMGKRRFCHVVIGNPKHPCSVRDDLAEDPKRCYVNLTMFEDSKEPRQTVERLGERSLTFFKGEFRHYALFLIETECHTNFIKELSPKLAVVQKFLTSKLGEGVPKIDVSHFVAASLFVFGSSLGAYLLLYHLAYTAPLLYDFYNYNYGEPEFFSLLQEFLQCLALFGALLYFLGMKNSIARKQLKKKTPTPKTKTG